MESVADQQKGLSGHYQQRLAKFKDMFAAPSVREAYEVRVQPYGETDIRLHTRTRRPPQNAGKGRRQPAPVPRH